MALTPTKRRKMEKLIYDVMGELDPTGANVEKYKSKFKKMSDNQFDTYFKKLFADKNAFLYLDVVDYERDLRMNHIENAAKVLDIPLMEYIVMPSANMSKESPAVSKHPVPVGYLPTKKLQQMVARKNTTSTSIGKRSPLTGQVTQEDKNARGSDAENFALATLDANHTLEEFVSARSDDMIKKREMLTDISRKGYTNLSGMTNSPANKVTLNTVNTFFLGMGLRTDLVNSGLVLTHTMNKK